MNKILKQLSGGDLRSEGRAQEVAEMIIAEPQLLADLGAGLQGDDKLIRARTCMAMEVISRDHPEILKREVPALIELAARDTVPQVRWHLAEIFGNTPLSDEQANQIIPILLGYLEDKSKIVKYTAVQTLGILGSGSSSKDQIVDRISGLKGESKSLDKAVTQALKEIG